MHAFSRREFLHGGLSVAALACAVSRLRGAEPPAERMRFGLVTYLWGQEWDLPTLIGNCEAAGVLGVELRTTHAHGVEPSLSAAARKEVRRRFEDSPVVCVGPGSNERFDDPNPDIVRAAVEASKGFVKLSHDIGGTGVKVKPDRFHPGVPREQTIAQIGAALNELGRFAADYGQQIRLEVHGQCAELPTIHQIMEIADHPQVAVCWNCNPQDLTGEGLAANFGLVRNRFGDTLHIHAYEEPAYPYAELFGLLNDSRYTGWVLLEAGSPPEDRVAALRVQREHFERLIHA